MIKLINKDTGQSLTITHKVNDEERTLEFLRVHGAFSPNRDFEFLGTVKMVYPNQESDFLTPGFLVSSEDLEWVVSLLEARMSWNALIKKVPDNRVGLGMIELAEKLLLENPSLENYQTISEIVSTSFNLQD